ncbi:MAG: GDP-mannose 4,6-dehydratase [Thermoplasmata archaeon]
MVNVLVTGGCGFVGTNLIEFILKEKDWDIRVLDDLSHGKLEYLESVKGYSESRVTFFKGDIKNEEDVVKALNDVEFIIHLAAQTSVMDSIENPKEDAKTNILGTINLLERAVDKNVERFVLASSAAPLGEQEMPIHEEKVPEPLSPYGASKLAAEGYCSAYAGSHPIKTVALRFSNVYGPKSWHKGSVVAKFIKQILKGKTPVIYGDGEQTRDFIHTEDISQAIVRSCTESLNEDFERFQVGTGLETSVNELYRLLEEVLESQQIDVPEPKYGEKREGEIYRNYADITKAKEELNYSPKISLKEGIEQTIRWFINNWAPDERESDNKQ